VERIEEEPWGGCASTGLLTNALSPTAHVGSGVKQEESAPALAPWLDCFTRAKLDSHSSLIKRRLGQTQRFPTLRLHSRCWIRKRPVAPMIDDGDF
jgi:hypothetical protein